MGQTDNKHRNSIFVPSLILAAIAVLFLFAGPVFAGSCTAEFTGQLMKSEERGETMEHFFKLVIRSSVDCATVKYELVIHQRTASGEEQIKRIRSSMTVRTGSDRARLVSHRTPKDTEIMSYVFTIIDCNVCGT